MEKTETVAEENTVTILNEITKLVQDIEKKVLAGNIKARECEELKVLKKKCCAKNPMVSLTAFHAIKDLVERKILIGSQTVSMLVSLLPSVNQYGALVSTIGNILLINLHSQTLQTGEYKYPYSMQVQHPFIIVLKYSWEMSWFEIYHFVLQLIQANDDIKLEHKIKFLRPIFRQLFWSTSWRGSQFQLKLFNGLLLESHERKMLHFTMETLLWQELDIHYCLFLQDFSIHLLRKQSDEHRSAVSIVTPALAQAVKWLIANGYNPGLWLKILGTCMQVDAAGGSVVLFILTDVIMETPSVYINQLIDICKGIIYSTHCNEYVAYKFVAVMLNWFVSPSFLANPAYRTLEEVLEFVTGKPGTWKDETSKLVGNEYWKGFGSCRAEVKFAVDLILASNYWSEKGTAAAVVDWLNNLIDSDQREMQFRVQSFLHGILLWAKDATIINRCLEILFNLMDRHREISFSLLCLLFYKLGRETNPTMQKIYLFFLPKLSVKKENIPLIVGIIESLKRGSTRIMTPLIIQLYLALWKFDNRTYSYLHKMLHENNSGDFSWEANVSKAIALKEICRLAPHLHAKDLVGVLSRILNECSGGVSGLPSAIAIEAVTDLCKAYVIDVAGTWNAIQPKLRVDKRPKVITSLCRFFGDIPDLNPTEQKNEELTKDIVSMLWNYTSFNDAEVVRIAFRALSNFPIENLPLKLIPETYRVDIKPPKDLYKNSKTPEDLLALPYVPAECWVQFLGKINAAVLQDGGQLVIAFVERELTNLPRGIFYLPPERAEPLSYSYLPSRSICRCLVELLQKQSRQTKADDHPEHVKEIIRVLSFQYSKLLPPLNWGFLEGFMPSCRRTCLSLLAKQAPVSASAKAILENYVDSTNWDGDKLEEILFMYQILPLLCKGVSYGILQNLLEQTIRLCLERSLSENSQHFGNILESLTETLRSKSVQASHKKLIVKQLERVLVLLPPESELMKNYAKCATEFPVQSVEEITSVKELGDVDGRWLRRAVTIRCAIAMREDIKNPLVWLNEFTEIAAHFPEEQNFMLNNIWCIIRRRRTCDHRCWVQELTWRIQASITTSTSRDSNKVTLFLVDVFVTVVIILSGCDYLFKDADEFAANEAKKLETFPPAACFLFSLPEWNDMLPKVGLWLQKLLKWKHLPEDRVRAFLRALLALREVKYTMDENESACVFNMFPLPFPSE